MDLGPAMDVGHAWIKDLHGCWAVCTLEPACACCTDAGSSCYGCRICLNVVPAIYLNRLETAGLYVIVTFIHAGSAWM